MTPNTAESRRDLRADILREATKLFAQQGYNATSVRQVCEACSCTKPALYYYFDSKDELYREAITVQMDALSKMIASFVSQPGPIRPRLHDALVVFVDYAQHSPQAMRLLQRVEMQPEEGAPRVDVAASRELHMRMMEDLVKQGIEGGEIRGDLDPRDAAIVLVGAIDFQFQLWLHCGEEWSQPRLHRTLDILFDGIGTR